MRRLLTVGVRLAVVPPLAAQKNVFSQEVSGSPDSYRLRAAAFLI